MPLPNCINIYSLRFDLRLRPDELYAFRGAMAALAGKEHDLFHNHDNSKGDPAGYHQRYPLIQYRVQAGQASVFALNEGAEALEQLHRSGAFDRFEMNGRAMPLQVAHRIRERGLEVSVTDQFRSYRIHGYLPFSNESYHKYRELYALRDRVALLERLLRNHVVAFAFGLGVELPRENPVRVVLVDFINVRKVTFKQQRMMVFDLVFGVNVDLPEGIALGRKTAFGFGTLTPWNGA